MRKVSSVLILLSNFYLSQQNTISQMFSKQNSMSVPNVSNFIRYKESPVDNYGGRVSFSIPIYTIESGDLTYPISLNYVNGGIRVNSQSSDVGLGWSLTNTVVTRIVFDDADWESIPQAGNYSQGNTCSHYDPLSRVLKKGFLAPYSDLPVSDIGNSIPSVDYLPDIFKFYSPLSASRSFFFPDVNTVKVLNNDGTIINWNIDSNKYDYLSDDSNESVLNNNFCILDYEHFYITTKRGVRYRLSTKDISHSFTNHGNLTGLEDVGDIKGTFPRVTTWHVDGISDRYGMDEIKFTYESYSTQDTNNIYSILENHPYFKIETRYPEVYDDNQYCRTGNVALGNDNAKYYNRQLQMNRLKKIDFKEGYVEFFYDLNREDLNNGKALTKILVKNYNGKIIKQFDLEYDYFKSDIQVNEFSKRLKLVSVKELGKGKYVFHYFEDSHLPNVGSLYQDFFGYCNQEELVYEDNEQVSSFSKYYFYPDKKEYSILPYSIEGEKHFPFEEGTIDKKPNELSKTWSLKRVDFPTGGSVEYDLESNVFNLWGYNLKGGGVRIKSQIIRGGESLR